MAKGYVGVTSTYTPVEYIESTGTQYIDTGYKLSSSKLKIQLKIYTSNMPSTEQDLVNNQDGETSRFVLGLYQNKVFGYSRSSNTQDTNVYSTTYSGTQTLDIEASYNYGSSTKSLMVNTLTTTEAQNATINNSNQTIKLLNHYNNPNAFFVGRCYYCKIWDNDILVRNFIPVIDDNNVPCLYEQVEGKFYYNQGTGTFTAGSATGQPVSLGDKARKIRRGYVGTNSVLYTTLDYIECTGTQYIDTGVVPKSTTRMVLDMALTDITIANRVGWGSTGGAEAFLCGAVTNVSTFYASVSNNWASVETTVPPDTNRHVWDMSNAAVKFDDVTYGTGNIGNTATTGQTLYLGALHVEWGAGIAYGKQKIYSCQIYDGNTLVRDYTPRLDNNNVPCLFDSVSGTYCHNNGTGSFSYGTATPVYGEVARIIKKGYVGINGVAHLCFQEVGGIPEYSTLATGQTTQKYWSAIVGTKDYMLEIGGGETSGSSPIKTAKAYGASGVATNAPDLPTQSWFAAATKFGENAVVAGGKTASSGSSRTDQCIVYTNNLARQALTTLFTSTFSSAAAATTNHFFVAGGTNYSAWQTGISAYDSSFAKSTPASMSATRAIGSLTNIGNYIVCCGGFTYTGAVDFYDNSNVKTTSTEPYGKITQYPLGLSTNSYAVFFGGSTSSSAANAYTDCKAYDTNKVLTSFNLPVAIWRSQGFSNGNYAVVCYQANEFIYDDNLVLVSHTTTGDYGGSDSYSAGTSDDFALVKKNGTTELYIFDI